MPSPALATLADDVATLLARPVVLDRMLAGGQHATTVAVRDGDRALVARRFPPGDDAVARELVVLPLLAPLGDLAPALVAHGAFADGDVLVTTMLAGGPVRPDVDPHAIARGMAAALARIHALPHAGLPAWPAIAPTGDGPLAHACRQAWPTMAMRERVLSHLDWWSGNAVWVDASLTGTVDWSSAAAAPRGVDVAWCRQDLVLLGAPEATATFLAEYERHAGVTVTDVHAWDVHAGARAEDRVETWAPNYAGVGRPDVTATVLRERLDAWNATLVAPPNP